MKKFTKAQIAVALRFVTSYSEFRDSDIYKAPRAVQETLKAFYSAPGGAHGPDNNKT